jgi:hypothetical protein
MARSRNHFAVETQQCFLCVVVVVVELHVTAQCIKILMLYNNAFVVNLCYLQRCKLYMTVYEGTYIPTNLHSSRFTYKKMR